LEPENDKKLMRIQELEEKTGIPRATIQYYIREGLLPRPVKTSKNMAYYDDSYVERLKLIKYLQEIKYLPLAIIKNMISEVDNREALDMSLVIQDNFFKPASGSGDIKYYPRDEFLSLTGLGGEILQKAEAVGFIRPKKDRGNVLYDNDDFELALCLKESMGLGLRVEDVRYYADLLKKIAEKEVQIYWKVIDNLPIGEEKVSRYNRMMDLGDRVRFFLHRKVLREKGEEYVRKRMKKGRRDAGEPPAGTDPR